MNKSIIKILDRIGEFLNKNDKCLYDDPYGGAWPGNRDVFKMSKKVNSGDKK